MAESGLTLDIAILYVDVTVVIIDP